MSVIRLSSGTEGPRHDPYSYIEILVLRDGKKPVTWHEGLTTGVRIGDMDLSPVSYETGAAMFLGATDMTPIQAIRAYRKAQEARSRAHRRHGAAEWLEGYPGESLLRCPCGEVIDSSFNLSAII